MRSLCRMLMLLACPLTLAGQTIEPKLQQLVDEFNARRAAASKAPKSPEATVGERLFQETRFAQFFAAHYDGNVNHLLSDGDPVVANIHTPMGEEPSPIWRESINCRHCHLVDELEGPPVYPRAYTDYMERSPLPHREDGQATTPRNSRGMVDTFAGARDGGLLHADGEFSTAFSLIESTMTGRNLGWLLHEHDRAVAHVARVIREDDGTGRLARRYGGRYSSLLLATDAGIPKELRIAAPYRIDVRKARDQEVVDAVARLIDVYLHSLRFLRDSEGRHSGSPYDLFLRLNHLPLAPLPGEAPEGYSRRLSDAIARLQSPAFVTPSMGSFLYHLQDFSFGELELKGLRIFLNRGEPQPAAAHNSRRNWRLLILGAGCLVLASMGIRRFNGSFALAAAVVGVCAIAGALVHTRVEAFTGKESNAAVHAGNCSSCHSAPDFTDNKFHNNGAAQDEYDSIHGAESFSRLPIPSYGERQHAPEAYLPATTQHPKGTGIFRSSPSKSADGRVDLGLWNVYANADYPEPQLQIRHFMCGENAGCAPEDVLPKTVGLFRTPTLRDLEQSEPFFHGGSMPSIEMVLAFYRRVAALQQAGKLRNGDPMLDKIFIDDDDMKALAAFLRSLNEDYD